MARAKVDEVRAGLELALEEILNVQNMNVWISVKERPIGKILESAGVEKKYNPYVMKALVKLGLVEEEGQLGGKMYKIKSKVIPDVKYLVKKIHEEAKAERKSYYTPVSEREEKQFDGYLVSKPSDLKPKRPYKRKDAHQSEYSSPAVKTTRQVIIPNLGDIRFLVYENNIVEGKIVSLHFGEDGKRVMYNVEIVNNYWLKMKNAPKVEIKEDMRDYDGEEDEVEPTKYLVLRDMSVKDLFETPAIAAEYLVRHTVKYIKK